jgi:glucuronosyltransferase
VSPVKYELGFYIPEDSFLRRQCRESLESYTSLPVSGSSNSFDLGNLGYFGTLSIMWAFGEGFCHSFLQGKEVQNLLHSTDEKFDLIVTEAFTNDCTLGFALKFKVPIVQVASFGGCPWMLDWFGNPSPYAYVPDPMQNFSDRMNLWQRILNTLGITYQKISRYLCHLPKQQAILEKYFSDYGPLPSISQLDSSTSLLLVNSHFSISYPRPLMPNIVQVGGMHLRSAKILPEVSTVKF